MTQSLLHPPHYTTNVPPLPPLYTVTIKYAHQFVIFVKGFHTMLLTWETTTVRSTCIYTLPLHYYIILLLMYIRRSAKLKCKKVSRYAVLRNIYEDRLACWAGLVCSDGLKNSVAPNFLARGRKQYTCLQVHAVNSHIHVVSYIICRYHTP